MENRIADMKSKMPMYLMVTFLGIVFAWAWYDMLSKLKPDIISHGDSLRIVYNHIKEEDVGYPYRFFITVSTSKIAKDSVKLYWLDGNNFKDRYPNLQKTDFNTAIMSSAEKGGFYAHSLPALEKAGQYYFFMEISDSQNNLITTMPENAMEKKNFYRVTYKQDPTKWVLLIHIFLMLVALFFLIHAFYFAFDYLWNKTAQNIGKTVSCIFWGLVCYGISGFPLGFWMAYEKYGIVWNGFPVGNDVTDNKTLFNFVYWFIILALKKRNIIGNKTFAWLTILGGVLTIVIRFAISHEVK
jgi:hypothetical protein